MIATEIASVEMKGAIIFLRNGMRALVRLKEQEVTSQWSAGSRIEVSLADSPVYQLRVEETGEQVFALLYNGNEQILPD